MKHFSLPAFARLALRGASFKVAAVATVGVALTSAISFASVSTRTTLTHDFTQADVDGIVAQIRTVSPDTFYIRVPTFTIRGQVSGSRVYGSLPITHVRRMASVQNVVLNETGNIMGLVMDPGNASQMSSGASSTRVALAIDSILANVTPNTYQFLR